MKLTVVGCSGSYSGPQSSASCYLLDATTESGGTYRVVIDMGNGAVGALQRYTSLKDIDAVLVSHLHADHCVDVEALYVALHYYKQGRGAPLPLYAPEPVFDRMIAINGSPKAGEALVGVYQPIPWRDGAVTELGPLRITSLRTNHPVETYGLRIGCGDKVFTYSADTDSCENLIELARDADVFLCEAAFTEADGADRNVHLTGLRAGQAAAAAAARSLVLTHIPPATDAQQVLAEARSAYDGPIQLACAGLEVTC